MKVRMNALGKQYPPGQVELTGILAEFRDALEEEIDEIKKSGQSSTLIYAGRQIESRSVGLWYRFSVEYIPMLPADAPCKLFIEKEQFDVTVVSLDENFIIISSKNPLPSTIEKARLENGSTVLMERLIRCIEENSYNINNIGYNMFFQNGTIYRSRKLFSYNDLDLSIKSTPAQNRAITAALTNDITYIWGPPGTGKTTVIGQIIYELYKHNRSVLVVSHTNTAVDGAIEKADKTYSKSHQERNASYPILRIGVPARSLPEKVLIGSHVAELGKELYRQKIMLEQQQTELQRQFKDIRALLAKDNWARESNLEQIREILHIISGYKNLSNEIQREIGAINISIQREKLAHPEYGRYLELEKKLKQKKDAYDSLCMQIEKIENEARDFRIQTKIADDESRKHDKFAQLKSEESKYMPELFFIEELNSINSNISSISSTIMTLNAEQASAKQAVLKYEKKGPLAKFFVGKGAMAQAQFNLSDISNRLSQSEDELQRQQRLKRDYEQQLENLLLLQEKIRAVTPSKTKNYWETVSKQLQSKLVAAENALSNLYAQKSALYAKLGKLEQEQNLIKATFDSIDELYQKLRQTQGLLETYKKAIGQERSRCSEYFEKECTLCAAFFFKPTSAEIPALFDELSNLLIKVKAEIGDIDVASLEQEKEKVNNNLIEIFNQLNKLNQKMQELERQVIINAKIVGTTLAKSYLSETLRERKFDTVILDEASMASIPALWCASCLAESSVVIVGDFLQLPPIVMAETPMAQKWLGKDIFYHSGMQERAKDKYRRPSNFIMLNDQFRMEPDIASIANMYYGLYGGLHSHDSNDLRIKERRSFYEWYPEKKTNHNVHLIDTESLHAWVTGVPQGKRHSRLNCFSAAVDVDLAFKLLENKLNALDPASAVPVEEPFVLIVAPYKPHTARVNQLIELEYQNRGFKKNLNYIRAGTIHSFQGSEADIVIFDLVIDEPHWKAGLFMTYNDINENIRRMFNVAITRSKFKLYVVCNFNYCQSHSKNNALSELLDKLLVKDHLPKIDAKSLLPNIVFSKSSHFYSDVDLSGKHIVCREESFNDYFMSDVRSFKKRLIVYSPFMAENRLSALLPAFADAVNEGKQIIIVTKALSDRRRTELAQYQKCESELRDIGVSVLHKKGMHEKLIFVDSEAVWIGSLNALSFTGLTGEIMQRHADKSLVSEYEKLFDIEHICGAIKNAHEQKCPICGQEMILRESPEGGIYWKCANNDYSRNTAQQYPVDGILRCKCGAPFVFAMKNEPRWVCSENPRHFQKMRKGDLKLEKMAALIPTKAAREEVDQYFIGKGK